MKLAAFMEKHALILQEVARETGLSVSTIWSLRNGRVAPSPGACIIIEDYTREVAMAANGGKQVPDDEIVTVHDLEAPDALLELLRRERARMAQEVSGS